jgi:hypothetical protein
MQPIHKTIQLPSNISHEKLFDLQNEIELTELYADDLIHIKDFAWLKHLITPVFISLCNNPHLLNLESLSSKPHLKRLLVNNTGISNLLGLEGCNSLEELSLQHCTKLTDLSGVNHLKTLKKIDLSYCPGIKSLDSLLSLPKLREINLRGCYQITDHEELYRIFPDYSERIRFN